MPIELLLILSGILIICLGLVFFWIRWIYKSYNKQKKKLFYVQISITLALIIWITWILRIFPGSSQYYTKQEFSNLTGRSVEINVEFVYESPRAFNGDGYSIWIYELTDENADYFRSPANEFFDKYPVKSDIRNKWEQQKWRRGPIEEHELKYLEFALQIVYPIDNEDKDNLNSKFAEVEAIVNSGNFLYSYNHYSHGDYVGNIDLYIISPDRRKLIIINHNT